MQRISRTIEELCSSIKAILSREASRHNFYLVLLSIKHTLHVFVQVRQRSDAARQIEISFSSERDMCLSAGNFFLELSLPFSRFFVLGDLHCSYTLELLCPDVELLQKISTRLLGKISLFD